jgi:hypothetical protein
MRPNEGGIGMPDVLAEVRQGWIGENAPAFLEAIHAGIVEALHTPEDDKVLRLIEHPPSHFTIPRSKGERYTHIEITMFAGRTLAAKRALYQAIVRNLQPFGVPPAEVKIILIEVLPESVGVRGGRAAADLDIGYAIEV